MPWAVHDSVHRNRGMLLQCTLYLTCYTVYPISYMLHSVPYILHVTTVYPISYMLHSVPYILHVTQCILYFTFRTPISYRKPRAKPHRTASACDRATSNRDRPGQADRAASAASAAQAALRSCATTPNSREARPPHTRRGSTVEIRCHPASTKCCWHKIASAQNDDRK